MADLDEGFDPGFDIVQREAHVVGMAPRIAPVADDAIDEDSRGLITAVRTGAGAPPMGEVPEYMRTMVKHPEIFRCQMEMGAVLFRGRIPARERELAVLRVGWLCRAPYEWGQHVFIAYRVGLTAPEISRVRIGSAAPGWSGHEAAILRGVEELIADKALSNQTWDTLALSWDEAQMIEFPTMVGQYVATAFVQNSLRIPLEGGNPGLAHA
ncbi:MULTISPECIES: carboxymuconolactone decarboxylase family protein [unclassified Novosphingobium]|uniref:carboxymuconolactone decarboxylase family protein n=1 Tax=unclassified Novosphingobium TaxID=2644732 RepID=UPI00135CA871|nr:MULTISPECIES: carboxymuconolactone decarboxylase family protein [unclassified Novosphingobium]